MRKLRLTSVKNVHRVKQGNDRAGTTLNLYQSGKRHPVAEMATCPPALLLPFPSIDGRAATCCLVTLTMQLWPFD